MRLRDTKPAALRAQWEAPVAVGMALFAAVRIFDGSFWALMAGQVGIAAMQPFVVNGISKLVAAWFSEEEGAIDCGER